MWKLLFSSCENRNRFYTPLLPKSDLSNVNTQTDVNECGICIFSMHLSLTGIEGALCPTGIAANFPHVCKDFPWAEQVQSCSPSSGLRHTLRDALVQYSCGTHSPAAENQGRGAQPKSCSCPLPLTTRQQGADAWRTL